MDFQKDANRYSNSLQNIPVSIKLVRYIES